MPAPDPFDKLSQASGAQLASLLQLAAGERRDPPAEPPPPPHEAIAAALAGLLERPIDALVRRLRPGAARQALTGALAGGDPILTAADLLGSPHPALELLEVLKDEAKRQRRDTTDAALAAAATAVYYAAIAAALLRCGTRISELSDEQLVEGFGWTARELREREGLAGLMNEAARRVGASGEAERSAEQQ